MAYHCFGVCDAYSHTNLHCADFNLSQCNNCAKYQQGKLEPNYPMPAKRMDVELGFMVAGINDEPYTVDEWWLI